MTILKKTNDENGGYYWVTSSVLHTNFHKIIEEMHALNIKLIHIYRHRHLLGYWALADEPGEIET